MTYDGEADAAYLSLTKIAAGEAAEQVMVERGRGRWRLWGRPQAAGYVILDFDRAGMLLGVEVVGARSLLPTQVLAAARRIDRDQP